MRKFVDRQTNGLVVKESSSESEDSLNDDG
jgi:hypothetical protein